MVGGSPLNRRLRGSDGSGAPLRSLVESCHSKGKFENIIKLQFLIHTNQLSSPRYQNLFKYEVSLCLKYFFIEYHYCNKYNK
ncbi:hypothetical protein ALC56_12791 [Trachymyrmex septentrionalis]|uniref:Uncharacterized protein n=1 Tax=Trachymyrmex septentrionalis TaxID=34720 RepID=A0A195EXG6_9HYME|nr:hypothetical protein ALC56_12791 [Trachymyrmex septentrionalis]